MKICTALISKPQNEQNEYTFAFISSVAKDATLVTLYIKFFRIFRSYLIQGPSSEGRKLNAAQLKKAYE